MTPTRTVANNTGPADERPIVDESAAGSTHHPQVLTSRGILVDEKIRPLIEALWSLGFETDFSCQGHPSDWDHPLECVWVGRHTNSHIVFSRYTDALEFMKVCAPVFSQQVEPARKRVAAFGCSPARGRRPHSELKAAVDFLSEYLDPITELWVTRAKAVDCQPAERGSQLLGGPSAMVRSGPTLSAKPT